MTRRLLLLLLLALATASPAFASEQHPTLAEIESEVMCPTCHTLLEVSQSPIADRMRAFIRRGIAAGETKSRIEAQLVANFGEAVLAAPPRRGFGLVAWILPLAGVLGSGGVVALVARRWRRTGEGDLAPPAAAGERLEPALERRLDEELARFGD